MVLVMAFLTIMMLEAIPGGYCSVALPDHASKKTREACEQEKDPPLGSKYVKILNRLVRLDLGQSLSSKRSIKTEIAEQLPDTLRLAVTCLLLSLGFGMSVGIFAAQSRHSLRGKLLNWVGMFLLSLPSFVLALLLMQLFALRLGWLHILGDSRQWQSMVMPVLAITIPLSALFMRLTRNAVIGVLSRDYIRTARAKGMRERRVLTIHALRNASAAIIPFAGLVLAGLLDGTLLIEAIFSRPGLGTYTFDALTTQDYPALQGVVLLVTVLTAAASLLADLAHAYLLPQSRDGIFE